MSRPALFGLCFAWIVIVTYLVNSVTVYDAGAGIQIFNPIQTFQNVEGQSQIEQTTTLLGTYWNGLTFRIDGLPVILNLFFQVPTAIIGYMILAFIRGN